MWTKRISLVLFFVFVQNFATSHAEKASYDNYRVYRVQVNNLRQFEAIQILEQSSIDLKFWKVPSDIGAHADILVPPHKFAEFSEFSTKFNFDNEILVNDVQKLIDNEQSKKSRNQNEEFGWDSYYTLSEIHDWVYNITKAYPKQATPILIGKSYEGRDILGVKISYRTGNPAVFIEANIHAREWVASAVATYVINELLTSANSTIREIAETIDWYIIPVLNVDGFSYSHAQDRLWRKTRQPNANSTCVGTDANRNFDFHWLENDGSSTSPCSETYAGPFPFSEPEAAAVADYLQSIKNKVSIYIAFHTYGQYLLSPFGHTSVEFPPNYKDLQDISAASVAALAVRSNTKYTYGSTGNHLYIASGTSVDWAYGVANISLGYTYEFRDTGWYGFVLPAEQLRSNCEEAIDGVAALVNKARSLRYL